MRDTGVTPRGRNDRGDRTSVSKVGLTVGGVLARAVGGRTPPEGERYSVSQNSASVRLILRRHPADYLAETHTMFPHRTSVGAFVAVLSLCVVGCSDTTGPGEDDRILELPRALTTTEISVIARSNAFGLELVREMAERDERPNIVLSPLSASMALGMTLNGAAGDTFEAMRATLGFDGLSMQEINDSYQSLIDLLVGLDPQVEFTIANSVWANADVLFHDSFFQSVTDAFDARVESRDFGAGPTLEEINGWVKEQTNGRIDRILDALDPDLKMLLLNAIFFDGSWTTRFDPDLTQPRDFRRADGSVVSVETMFLGNETLPHTRTSELSAVELTYGGGAYSMVVIVPQPPNDARSLLATLDDTQWESIMDALTSGHLDQFSMPKLTLEYDGLLNEPLKEMGMGIAFHPGADFTEMSPEGDQFCISFVRQKTFIEVDEEGTTAAAVTAVGVGPASFSAIDVDRPFVFAIRERLSGTILFMGVVGDPTAEDSGPAAVSTDCVG